jgi:hypothetical protein
MAEKQGQINHYICETCKGLTRTINRDEGTTPFMIRCKITGCGGLARSSFYQVSQDHAPGWEWIRPTPEEFEEYLKSNKVEMHRREFKEHCDNGGMLMRKMNTDL